MISPVLPVYARADLQFERGEGCYLYTKEGQRYLDFAAGIAVASFGHAHPRLISALTEQAKKVWILSNMFRVPGQELLAKKLCDMTFADTMFFSNSGAEAWECGVKLVRHHFWAKGQPEKNRIIVMEGCFHGRTIAAISAAKTAKMVDGFAPLLDGFDMVPFGDLAALKAAIGPNTASIHFEPVQGEGGIRIAPPEFLQAARQLCDEHGLLLYLDEIQCGVGRTGKMWAYEHAGITPDVMCIAKAMGGGFPVGACLATEHAAAGITIGSHGSTYGGNPLAMAVALEALTMATEPGFLEHVNHISGWLLPRLEQLAKDHPKVFTGARGIGLMAGLQCVPENLAVQKALRENGLIVVYAGENRIRLLPPLIMTETEGQEALDILAKTAKQLTL